MNTPLRIAWLAPYPVQQLEPCVQIGRRLAVFQPCSWIVNLAPVLAQQPNVELHLITESTLVKRHQVARLGNITFHIVKTGVPFTHRGYPPYFPLDVLTKFAATTRKLVAELNTIAPDIVHAHGTEGPYALAAIRSGRPCLVAMQGIIAEIFKTNPCFRYRIVRHYERFAVRTARYFACRTAFDSGFVRAINPAARIFTVQEAIHPVFFRQNWQPQDNPTVLFVGSLEKHKGLHTLLEAVALIAREQPRIRLKVIGGTRTPGDWMQRCRQLGIEDRVEFLGFLSPEEIARHHLESQLFVLPSENDNSPNALAEAMVSGMPVIATNVGGIPSMVEPGVSGALVPARDPRALQKEIARLLACPDERARLGQQARTVARIRHLPERVARETMDAYKEILNDTEKHR